jgi:hypothetical protein
MPAITLAQAQTRLSDWMAADEAVSRGQAYSVGGRSFTRAQASEIRQNIEFWERKVNALASSSGGGRRVRYGVYS